MSRMELNMSRKELNMSRMELNMSRMEHNMWRMELNGWCMELNKWCIELNGLQMKVKKSIESNTLTILPMKEKIPPIEEQIPYPIFGVRDTIIYV